MTRSCSTTVSPDSVAKSFYLVVRPGEEVEDLGEEGQSPHPAEALEGVEVEVGADAELGILHTREEPVMLLPLPRKAAAAS